MTTEKKISLHEDWTAVVLGGTVILLALLGIIIPNPITKWQDGADLASIFSAANLGAVGLQFIFVMIISTIGAWLTNKPIGAFVKATVCVYLLTLIALLIAGNKGVADWNFEAVIFSLLLGLLISNLFELPEWFKKVLSTELFVKIGLVLLGASVVFSDILEAGSLGLIQSLIVVLAVWYFAFWICKKLKIDDELAMMISSSVSICGVSAAIATSGAIKGDSKKLSYVISLVLVTAVPMMLIMPWVAERFGFSEEVTGAWLGGSIDTSGAVVASGSMVGETALKISTIVKFSQNVLLGIAAFIISIYWSYTKHPNAEKSENKPSLKVIWDRFPKFVLGFVGVSLIFSFFISAEQTAQVKGSLKSLQGLWFALAFTSIGLETKFADLFNKESKKPLYAFLTAQTFNIFFTLIVAYLLFGD